MASPEFVKFPFVDFLLQLASGLKGTVSRLRSNPMAARQPYRV